MTTLARLSGSQDWRTGKLKYVVDLTAGGTPEVGREELWTDGEDGYPWVTIADMTASPVVVQTYRRVSPRGISTARLKIGRPGTLLFAMYASIGTIADLAVPGVWNQAILGITPHEGTEIRFIRYALLAARPRLLGVARSNTQDNLNAEQVRNLEIRLPGPRHQRRIAEFLDRECAHIERLRTELSDAAILADSAYTDALRRLILEPDYRFVPLKHYARTGTGHTPSRENPEYWVPDELVVPWFTLADVHQIRDGHRDVVIDTAEKISERGLANSAAVKHPAGTVMLSRTASVGFSAVMGVDMAVSQDFMTWTCGPKLEPRFLLLTLRAMQQELRGLMYGSTHKTIYMPDLLAIRVPLPSVERQREIVRRASRIAQSTRPLVDGIRDMNGLLAEYRDALITEAVTGQLDITRLRDSQTDENLDTVRHSARPEVLGN